MNIPTFEGRVFGLEDDGAQIKGCEHSIKCGKSYSEHRLSTNLIAVDLITSTGYIVQEGVLWLELRL